MRIRKLNMHKYANCGHLLDILGYRKAAQGYREMMPEWERMYNEHDYPDYDE